MAKKSFIGAIAEKTDLREKTGIKGVFSSTEETPISTGPEIPLLQVELQEKPIDELRQSFIVLTEDFEKLKDFVYFKKSTEDPLYSQKEALHMALQLLFAKEESIPERPEKVKKQERRRNANIRKKRAKK
jgi:hypothetical protein